MNVHGEEEQTLLELLARTSSTLEKFFIMQLYNEGEMAVCLQCPLPYQRGVERNARFKTRSADMAWHEEKVAVEIQGGTYMGGKHSRGPGQDRDFEKGNDAAIDGWIQLSFSSKQLDTEYPLIETAEALRRRRHD